MHAPSPLKEREGASSRPRSPDSARASGSKIEEPATHDHAQRLATRLETLDAEFKTHHFALIDHIDDEANLGKEQEVLDQHDDDVNSLVVRLQQLITVSSTAPVNSDLRKALTRKLQHLEKSLTLVSENINTLSSRSEDVCRLQQHEEQLSDYKKDLADIPYYGVPFVSKLHSRWYLR